VLGFEDTMRRREFIGLVGTAAVVGPLTVRAQQSATPVVGLLSSFSANQRNTAAFNKGLKELGFVDGQNVVIDYRYAEGHYDHLPGLAAELVRRPVAAIFATGGNGPALAARAATTAIPIVFESGGGDPVKVGLVASINRPGGNITGISIVQTAVLAKRFELLHQLVPKAKTIGVLFNPGYPDAELQIRQVQDAAASIERKIAVASARTEDDLDSAFAILVDRGANALFAINDPYFASLRGQIVALAARYALPAAYFPAILQPRAD
jgi:putative tryptophan/tyrosine transport system substrate-binding protein